MSKEKKAAKPAKAKAEKKAAKPRNSVTKLVRAKIGSGVTNVDTILSAIHKEFPDAKATPGYVRHIARNVIGKPLPVSQGEKKAKAAKPAKAKGEKKAKAVKAKPAEAGDAQGEQAEL